MTIDKIEKQLLDKLRNTFGNKANFRPAFDSHSKANWPTVPTGVLYAKSLKIEPLHIGSSATQMPTANLKFVQGEFELLLLEGKQPSSMPFVEFQNKVTAELFKSESDFTIGKVQLLQVGVEKNFSLKQQPILFSIYSICEG